MCRIGIDLGGTNIAVGVVDSGYHLISEASVPAGAGRPAEQVVAEVSSRFKANPKTVFLIGGAKDVPYDEIIKALNLLHSAGVKSVGLMTQPI